MDYNTLIHVVCDPLVENPSALLIREIKEADSKNTTILICSESEDIARMIGKKGCVANAIREIVSIAGKLNNQRVRVKFESFDENKE